MWQRHRRNWTVRQIVIQVAAAESPYAESARRGIGISAGYTRGTRYKWPPSLDGLFEARVSSAAGGSVSWLRLSAVPINLAPTALH